MSTEDKVDDVVIDEEELSTEDQERVEVKSGSESSDDDEHHDEQGSDEETEEERAERTERNRQRRRESKERRKEHIESLKRELAARDSIIQDLNQRMSVVERKSTGSEMAQLETAERQMTTAYNKLREINQQAIERADGKTATEAQERMFQLRQKMEQIQNVKQAMHQREARPQPLDPRLVSNAEAWMSDNKWYDPSGKDADSAVVLTLDNRLAQEGWDPRTPEYWDELDKRARKYLPHKYNSGYNSNQSNRGSRGVPVAGSSRNDGGSSSSTSYRLSPDRVQALKDAGLWDDPQARSEAIKRYQKFDKEQRK